MTSHPQPREFDVVVFGATGFTGSLVAAYLAAHAPAGTRWAVAGRDAGRLAALRDRLGVDVPVRTADVTDPDSLRALAESSRVVATTVGPYIRHGEPLVAACAAAGRSGTRPSVACACSRGTRSAHAGCRAASASAGG